MKKRLLFPGLLLLPILLMAQQTAKLKPVSEIFEEGFKYLNGINKNYDPQKAVQLFREAAAKGDAAAMNALGNLYLNGYGGVEKNMNTAIQYYKQAGQAGYGAGYYNLAKLYKDNKDLEQDLQQSAIYAKAGADLRDNNSKKLLAYYHFKGFGVRQDYYKAFELYSELAQAGIVNAQYFVGLCYRNGYGTIANPDEAKKWLLMAARQGDYQATHELTAELNPENSNVNNPEIQQQVNKLKTYHEKLIAANSNDISGEYRGFAIYYDFSGKFVHEVVPLSLILKQTQIITVTGMRKNINSNRHVLL